MTFSKRGTESEPPTEMTPSQADAYNIVEPLLIDRGLLDNLPAAVGLSGEDIESRLFDAAVSLALEEKYTQALPRLEEYLRQ